ncbi:MAG: AgmX/PglI C-terminal domain-containing protein [Myxococcota bacterium]
MRALHDTLDHFVPPGRRPEDGDERAALEVHQLWGRVLLETRHWTPTVSDVVTVGSATGWRWSFLGVDMGWVAEPWQRVLPWLPPMWSEVDSRPRNDFSVAHGTLSDTEHTLFRWDGEHWRLTVPDGWHAHVRGRAGRRQVLSERDLALSSDRMVVVEAGDSGLAFAARLVPAGQRIAERHSGPTPWGLVSIFLVMAMLGLSFAVAVSVLPLPPTVTVAEVRDIWGEVTLTPPPEPEPTARRVEEPEPAPPEGSEPRKKVKTKAKLSDVARAEEDQRVASTAGIASQLDEMLGGVGLPAGLADQVGGLIGVKGASPIGGGGLGSRGSGLGSGGRADALGGLGTRGGGSGKFGPRTGRSEADLGRIVQQEPLLIGSLDRRVVDEVIKRHLDAIRYCYQRELPVHPNLAGKVVVRFTIAKDGSVAAADLKETTLGNARAEACVTGRFRRMTFPAPQGGGIVIVSYPFLFSAG